MLVLRASRTNFSQDVHAALQVACLLVADLLHLSLSLCLFMFLTVLNVFLYWQRWQQLQHWPGFSGSPIRPPVCERSRHFVIQLNCRYVGLNEELLTSEFLVRERETCRMSVSSVCCCKVRLNKWNFDLYSVNSVLYRISRFLYLHPASPLLVSLDSSSKMYWRTSSAS